MQGVNYFFGVLGIFKGCPRLIVNKNISGCYAKSQHFIQQKGRTLLGGLPKHFHLR